MPLRPTDSDTFAAMLSAVAAVYGREVTPDVTAIYWSALAPYDLAAVRQAFDRHVRNPDVGQFLPKPADLIRMLGGTTVDGAMQAWARVERAIRCVGGHESVVFDDPLIHRCIADMGGWPKLCDTLEADLPFRAKDFQTLYRGFAARRERPEYPPTLIGRFEAANRISGHPIASPMLIGAPDECRRVLEGGGGGGLRITRDALAIQ